MRPGEESNSASTNAIIGFAFRVPLPSNRAQRAKALHLANLPVAGLTRFNKCNHLQHRTHTFNVNTFNFVRHISEITRKMFPFNVTQPGPAS